VNVIAVNEISAEDATTEPKYLLDPVSYFEY
jgi:hypothetical protein